jgi:hypothetical protein
VLDLSKGNYKVLLMDINNTKLMEIKTMFIEKKMLYIILFFLHFFMMLEITVRALCMVGKDTKNEPQPQQEH